VTPSLGVFARCRQEPARTSATRRLAFDLQRFVVALVTATTSLIWVGLFIPFTGSMMQNAALLWHVSAAGCAGRKGLAPAWSAS